MKKYSLTRDGIRPLAFTGEQIANDSTHSHQGSRQNRWHEVTVYRTAKGKIIVQIEYHTCWQGESDRNSAQVFDDLPSAVAFLESEDGQPELAASIASELGVSEEIE